ncbi:MAG: GTPase, partial [Nostoc sp. NMS4]|nr:GTPase [Nostoc sp. NMS4]
WQEPIQVAKTKKTWYTLWLGKKTYYETEYKTRSSDNATIPSIEDLLIGWQVQAKQAELEIVKEIASWFLQQSGCVKKNVDKIQKDILDRYEERLDTAHREITIDYEMQKNVWQPMQQKAISLMEDFNNLGQSLKEEL